MAPEIAAQERIYRALKQDLFSNGYRAGTRLDLQAIAERNRASTTPVREAIHRLFGERIVEPHTDGGFQIAIPDTVQLVDLYMWNAQHLLTAVHVTRGPALVVALQGQRKLTEEPTARARAMATAALFSAIGHATGNSEFLTQIEAANDRLHFPRMAEATYFGDVGREFLTLTRTGTSNVQMNMRRRILAYHRRRIEHVAQIVGILRRDILR